MQQTRNQQSGFADVREVKNYTITNQQQETSNKKPATRNQQQETSNKKPATRNQQQETSNKKPATRNQQQETSSRNLQQVIDKKTMQFSLLLFIVLL